MSRENKDIILLNAFFIELYDTLYQHIIFDEVKVAKKILRILEELALPMEYVGEGKWRENLKKIKKMKI